MAEVQVYHISTQRQQGGGQQEQQQQEAVGEGVGEGEQQPQQAATEVKHKPHPTLHNYLWFSDPIHCQAAADYVRKTVRGKMVSGAVC